MLVSLVLVTLPLNFISLILPFTSVFFRAKVKVLVMFVSSSPIVSKGISSAMETVFKTGLFFVITNPS